MVPRQRPKVSLQWCQMRVMASQITENSIASSKLHSGQQERKHQSSLWWPVDSSHIGLAMLKVFPRHDVIRHEMTSSVMKAIVKDTNQYIETPTWSHSAKLIHIRDVTMSAMTSQIAGVLIVYSAVCSSRSKKTTKLRVTGICVGNSPVTGEFPAQMASSAENVSIWWRHHANCRYHKVALNIRTSPWYSSNNSKVSVVTVKSPNSTKIQFLVTIWD